MSKASTTSVPKIPAPSPAKNAWSKGPPLSTTTPSPRSQSPALPNQFHQTHSRRSSTLGPAVSVKDGVSVSKGNVGAIKPSQAVTFGSIGDSSPSISSSTIAAPIVKPLEGVKSFGTVPATAPTGHVNGKASISSKSSVLASGTSLSMTSTSTPLTAGSTTASVPTATSSPAPVDPTSSKVHLDVRKLFQNPQGTTSSASDTPSSSARNTNVPPQPSSSHQSQPHPPSQLGPHQYPSFPPNSIRQSQHSGSNGTPRSPSFSRAMPNGSTGPRPQGAQTVGPPPTGLPSPRPGTHTHNAQTAGLPPPPQMSMQPTMSMWPQAYYYPEQYNMYWYPTLPMQTHPQHQPPPQGQHLPHHPTMPMSPRNPSSNLQPSTPTLSHAPPTPVHSSIPPPPHPHQQASHGLAPSPSTPSSTISLGKGLNAASSSFIPRKSAPVSLKTPDGVELDLENRRTGPNSSIPSTPGPIGLRQGSPGTRVRIESEEQRKQRLAEELQKEAKVKAEAEEKAKKEEEAAARKVREEEERKRREAEAEKEQLRKAEEEKEKERLRKEEEERLKKEEEERLRKEAEEREVRLREEERRQRQDEARRLAEEKAEEERLQREREAREKEEREKAEKEQERLAREAEDKRLAEEAPKTAAPLAQIQDGRAEEIEEGEINEDQDTQPPNQDGREKVRESLRIDTNAPAIGRRRHPGPLDLEEAKKSNVAAPQSALATARIISDIHSVPYPEGVHSPNPALNQNAKEGKFRYDRDFLLQFMSLCKEKPASLPPLDAIGIEPLDPSSLHLMRGGSARHRTSSAALPPQRQASIGLGFSSSTMGKGGSSSFNPMGNFATGGGSKLSSEDRFAASSRAASVSGAAGMQFPRPMPLTRTASTGGPATRERTRSKRGEKRNEGNKLGSSTQTQAAALQNHHIGFEIVAPLQATANRWDRKILQADGDSPEMVERKVKGLLNKLTMEKFDSISDQIISWANKSENEKDGRTLIQVIKLVFEKATDEATWSEMYARLCRKMMEQISSKVQDDGIKNNEGKPITGGQLFRKYLLNRCQEDFERGWIAKETAAAAAATKAMEDEAVKAANETKGDQKEEYALYSEEYYIAQKAKRRGLGLIKFIGELFKLQMLTERIMHECVKKLLGNVDNPEEEEIESLCKLLTTVGGILDTPKARAHMDVYFSRMKELTKSLHVTPRMQFMLQDVIELRERKWISRQAHGLSAPATIAQVHEAAAKEKAAQEKEAYQRQMSMSRGGSRRGGDRGEHAQVGPDGWSVPARPGKVGDLSNFGKISKQQPMMFGPGSVFAGKKNENKKESISRTASSSNMFSMLSSQTAEIADSTAKPIEPQRKRLVLQPRSKPVEATETTEGASPDADSDSSVDDSPSPVAAEMSEKSALKKIDEDAKEFFAVRNIHEDDYFTDLPPKFHSKVVEKLAGRAVEAKAADAELLAQFFAHASSKGLCAPEAFEEGLGAIAEFIDDIICDAPKALELFAIILKGAGLDENRQASIAAKSSENSDKLLGLLR